MKKLSEIFTTENDNGITITTYQLSDEMAEMYCNIQFVYNSIKNPECFVISDGFLKECFNIDTLDEFLKTYQNSEIEFLENNGFVNACQECGHCFSYTCTFLTDSIVSVVETHYMDI